MSLAQSQLLAALEQLQARLDESESLDAEAAARIQEIIREIELTVTGKQKQPAHEATLTDRMREATLEFEASHPTLSGSVGGVIDALARMGI